MAFSSLLHQATFTLNYPHLPPPVPIPVFYPRHDFVVPSRVRRASPVHLLIYFFGEPSPLTNVYPPCEPPPVFSTLGFLTLPKFVGFSRCCRLFAPLTPPPFFGALPILFTSGNYPSPLFFFTRSRSSVFLLETKKLSSPLRNEPSPLVAAPPHLSLPPSTSPHFFCGLTSF